MSQKDPVDVVGSAISDVVQVFGKVNDENFGHVTKNTQEGKYLRGIEVKEIFDLIGEKEKEEEILFLWVEGGKFDKVLTPKKETMVGITNKRLFKLEKGGKWIIKREIIKEVRHQKNGWLAWDKIVITLKDGRTDTIGIYDEATCQYFCNYLNSNKM